MVDRPWERITSATDEYQVLQALRTNRRARNREDAFLVEGVRNISAAVAAGWQVEAVLAHQASALSSWARQLVASAGARRLLELDSFLFDGLTDREDLPELLLVVRRRKATLSQVVAHDGFLAVVVDRPASPGNLGTIIRTADAMGVDAVVASGHGADLYDPRCVRATAGSFFALDTFELAGPRALAGWVGEQQVRPEIIVADEAGDDVLGTAELSRPLVVVLGNETSGPSRAYLELADRTMSIPMSGTASSLNVAEANAMFLYEIDRQARAR